ncbi:hypothetical protein B0H13DRAFT_2056357 [Mycena leptocephala]|nr:hypothetical protein B0H13DRAFT_2056357 [Mycena leptocephala]
MVALAQELIDAIVDEVATDLAELWLLPQGRANLKACSLVSRTFQVQSQRQLFQMLTLHRNVDHLAINLAGSPHLASYVRDLRIYMNFHRRHELTTILPLLSRVRRLVLYGGRDSEEWGKFSIDFCKQFVSLLLLPSLHSLALVNFRTVPVSVIRHALSSYKELFLRDTGIADGHGSFTLAERAGPITSTTTHLTLDSYSPERARALQPWILSNNMASSLQNIQHVELHFPEHAVLQFAYSLRCMDSIQRLVLNFGRLHNIPPRVRPVDLPSLPRLRFLTLKASVSELHIPPAALSVLGILPVVMPELEAVRIVIFADYEGHKDDNHRLDVHVDTALQSMPRLREVHFVLSIFRPSEQAQFGDCIRQKLPMANEAGLLSWSACSWHKFRHPLASFSLC